MPTLGAALDFAKLEGRNFRAHQLSAAPGSPVAGQLYYDTVANSLYYFNGTVWVAAGAGAGPADATTSTKGIVQLAGDLAGTATSPQIAALAVTDAEVATANKDGVAGTASMRTLGTGATQAAAGNDARFTDSRAPNGTASGDLSGTYPSPQIAAGVVVDADVNATAAIAETKLSLATDAAAGTGSRRTIGTGALQAAAGNDSRFTDARTPTGTAGGDLSGTYPNPQILTGAIIDTDVNATYRDGAVGTASLRTLGAGALQAMPGNRTLDAITVAAADVNINTHKLTNVVDPTGAQDAATKNYVDLLQQGLDSHPSVRAATTANVTLAGSAPNTLDGVTLAANDRVLVKDQTTTNQNGIYTVTTLGTGANGTWSRAADQDTWGEVPSAYVWVEAGTTQADTGWTCTSDQGGTLGTTAITWVQFSSAGAAIAGAGLTKTGNTIDAVGTANRISVAADAIDISTAYVGQATITTLGTIATGVWNGTAVPVANGGTGQTTAKLARETGLVAPGYYNNAATHGAGTTISITAATHGLRASRGILVQVQDNSTGNVLLPDVSVASNGDVTVTFAVSQTANTILVTLIG